MKFAQILNKLMNDTKVSAYKISKDTGISDRLIGYWKKGEKLPGAENLLTLANYFGISIDYLLTGKEKISSLELTKNEQRIIDIFKSLTETQQGQVIERAEMLSESNEDKN